MIQPTAFATRNSVTNTKQDLVKARVAAAKSGFIRTYLQGLAYNGDELPVEVHIIKQR